MTVAGGTEYSEFDRGRMVALRSQGLSYPQIAQELNFSLSGVYSFLQRYNKYHTYKSRPRSGRPVAISPRKERHIVATLRKHRFHSYRNVAELVGNKTTWMQVRNVAHQNGYHRRSARRKPYLRQSTVDQRLKWAKDNTGRDWNGVAWSDECSLETGESPGQTMVTRRPGEEFLPSTIVPTFRSGRKTLMVSGVIANGRKGPLIPIKPATTDSNGQKRKGAGGMNGEDYVEQVLKGPLLDFYRSLEEERGIEMYLVEDGASTHRRKLTQVARDELGIRSLPHPPSSPDLNPIEPLWQDLKKGIAKIPRSRNSLESLWKAAKQVWDGFTDEDVAKYTSQMDARVQAVKKAKGFHTRF
ncbi:Transposable element Tc1 transposase [Ceratobasidium sp. AG-Ba]|nr:Transposable element Tc1 transposase [Ceratobasidium sp. AG-Ba]QRV99643.1 Transposable element Tc1 transposase [Ceratobasidium sp. AG-Ba]